MKQEANVVGIYTAAIRENLVTQGPVLWTLYSVVYRLQLLQRSDALWYLWRRVSESDTDKQTATTLHPSRQQQQLDC